MATWIVKVGVSKPLDMVSRVLQLLPPRVGDVEIRSHGHQPRAQALAASETDQAQGTNPTPATSQAPAEATAATPVAVPAAAATPSANANPSSTREEALIRLVLAFTYDSPDLVMQGEGDATLAVLTQHNDVSQRVRLFVDQVLQSARGVFPAGALDFDTVELEGDPRDTLPEVAKVHDAKAIVLQRPAPSFVGTVAGTVQASLVHNTQFPIVVFPPDWPASSPQDAGPAAPTHTIAIAVDQSSFATGALDWALEALCGEGSEIHLIHCVPRVMSEETIASKADLVESIEKRAKSRCQRRNVRVAVHLVHGDARYELSRSAQHFGARLLVVGSRGHGMLQRTLLGSLSSFLVDNCPLPVAIVKTHHAVMNL